MAKMKKIPLGKLRLGPGGMHCPCCTKVPPTEMKKKINRHERRQGKIDLKKGVE